MTKPNNIMVPGVTVHAQRQIEDRFGIAPTRDEWISAVMSILEGRAPVVRVDGSSTVYAVTIRGSCYFAAWINNNDTGSCIATILPGGRTYARDRRRPKKRKKEYNPHEEE